MMASDAVERFLATGEYDRTFADWPGNAVERRRAGSAMLREVLARVVGWRAKRAPGRIVAAPADAEGRVRAQVAPMLAALFPADEADVLMRELPPRVHVLTPGTYGRAIVDVPLRSAWDLANVLLDDLGAPPLADDTPELDGLCLPGHAWVLPRAFASTAPFEDVLVHEMAHLLHTTPRETLRLEGKGALLDVPPRRRETWAYGCEIWSCVVRHPGGERERVAAWRAEPPPEDARVDHSRLGALLEAAAERPSDGWAVLRGWATGRR